MKKTCLFLALVYFFLIPDVTAQNILGTIQPNTNEALPASYNFQEFVFAEPDDEGDCIGLVNENAVIEELFFAQTHRHSLDHPFHFIIGHRPALLQVAVSGTGPAPDVQVEGFKNGSSIGVKCLKGPTVLSQTIDLSRPDFENYFTVTLPKSWIEMGLELEISLSHTSRYLNQSDLKIGPYTEMNLVRVDQDFMDFNDDPHNSPEIENFLAETASAIPVSVVRYGAFPETLVFPEIIATNETEELVRLKSKDEKQVMGVANDGYINSIAVLALGEMHKTTNDRLSTIYFGNTLNLAPGGWGGGGSFVSPDFTDIYIHELGHALSLPHWGSAYELPANDDSYQYPYGGEDDDGGGRGESWNFIQATYDFIDPICRVEEDSDFEGESSDAMQRNHSCLGVRTYGTGPWDGFGDFSAYAMHHYYIGTEVKNGTVFYRGENKVYQVRRHEGLPILSLENGARMYNRLPGQKEEKSYAEKTQVPGEEILNTEVYLVYGTAHGSQQAGNIIYKPIKYNGTLPPIIDPTDSEKLQEIKDDPIYRDILGSPRDITLKMTYADGSILHALIPTHSYVRPEDYGDYYGHFRYDLSNYSLVVPGEKELIRVEHYRRPFLASNPNDTRTGNLLDPLQGITAENYMDNATYITEYGPGRIAPLGPNSIGNRVWFDANKNGIDDNGEEGIAGVKVALWKDNDEDGVPTDWCGFTTTDENGYYRFTVTPGAYTVFVWQIDNWDEGGPLNGLVPSAIFTDANNDIDKDNNGRGLPGSDLFSGIITITADGEPLNDGDPEDDWFDLDPAGNQTVDFGFYCDTPCNDNDQDGFDISEDCDDNNPNVNPNQAEIVYNGIDDDCNPLTLDDDLDEDGFDLVDDCDDTDASVNSAQAEIVYNGIDDDCNPLTLDDDLDGDGFDLVDDCDDENVAINPDAEEILNNGIDEDCDGMDLVTSTAAPLLSMTVSIFPNPTKGVLNIKLSGTEEYIVSIFTLSGMELLSHRNASIIDMQSLTDGAYLLEIKDLNSGQRLVERIIKLK